MRSFISDSGFVLKWFLRSVLLAYSTVWIFLVIDYQLKFSWFYDVRGERIDPTPISAIIICELCIVWVRSMWTDLQTKLATPQKVLVPLLEEIDQLFDEAWGKWQRRKNRGERIIVKKEIRHNLLVTVSIDRRFQFASIVSLGSSKKIGNGIVKWYKKRNPDRCVMFERVHPDLFLLFLEEASDPLVKERP